MTSPAKRYRIAYRDDSPGAPEEYWHTRAYDIDHAIERFHEGPDADGWRLLSIVRVSEDGKPQGKPVAL